MPIFAAVDIGSNSVRLKIAEDNRDRLKTVFEDREVTRLGAGVFANGSLEPQAMAYTIQVLQRFCGPPRAMLSTGCGWWRPARCATQE